jgi:hypothetical protein
VRIGKVTMSGLLHNLGERLAGRVIDLLPVGLRAVHEPALRLDKPLSKKFVFKLAQTQAELEACFRLLHDEYVKAGLMRPDPSGMRVTLYHALPTTSMLMCKYGQKVVGTVSLIRKSKLGYPMQQAFNLDEVFQVGGNVAEVSALAISSHFNAPRELVLIPMLKFLYEYAEYRFDTRHLVIAVNPRQIVFYEKLFFFRRLRQRAVSHYDFVRGAPAVGAYLDLVKAKEIFFREYGNQPDEKNLYHYFTAASLPNGQFPHRRFHTTTDPVMTPELLDYFFNKRTKIFSTLKAPEVQLLHTVYNLPEYRQCLPARAKELPREHGRERTHRRFQVRCPARLYINRVGVSHTVSLIVYECSEKVFCARSERPLAVGLIGEAEIDLGEFEQCSLLVQVKCLSKHSNRLVMLKVCEANSEQSGRWLKFVRALSNAPTADDLEEATRFYDDAQPVTEGSTAGSGWQSQVSESSRL